MPVYCSKCRYLVDEYGTYSCKHPDNTTMADQWLEPMPAYKQHPKEINQHCDCSLFEKKLPASPTGM